MIQSIFFSTNIAANIQDFKGDEWQSQKVLDDDIYSEKDNRYFCYRMVS